MINAAIFSSYCVAPKLFFFRAWEYFNVLVYTGFEPHSDTFLESGDSARDFLFQRYLTATRVSINKYGNRRQFIDDETVPNILMLGDSQLFGSGVTDIDVITWILSEKTGVPVYNGARRHEINLLRHPLLRFRAVIFTATERESLHKNYCRRFGELKRILDASRLPLSHFLVGTLGFRNTAKAVRDSVWYVYGVIGGSLNKILGAHPLFAPAKRIIIDTHGGRDAAFLSADVRCAQKLSNLFRSRGIATGFFYFPAYQTIYGKDVGLKVDSFTLDYIDLLTDALRKEGLLTFNSKACLLNNGGANVYQMQDTHVNGFGHRLLANCMFASPMKQLFLQQ